MFTNQLISIHSIKGLYRVCTESKKFPSNQPFLSRIPLTTDQEVEGSTPSGRTSKNQKLDGSPKRTRQRNLSESTIEAGNWKITGFFIF